MFPTGTSVLAAVSGGADSMCLLHWLWTNADRLKIRVSAAHFEHGIRGDESLRDRDFVKSFCEGRGIPFYTDSGDVHRFATENSLSIEEAARILRYDFLERARCDAGADVIATAHNADDNAETVIINLTRGTGIRGLEGIPPVRDRIVRPLLSETRQDIERYDAENSVDYVTDSTNLADEYSRNRIRHNVMPLLKEINPGLCASVLRTGDILREDEDCLQQLAEDFISTNFDGNSVSLKALRGLHPAVFARVVRALCPRTLSAVHVKAIYNLAQGTELGWTDVPGARIRRQKGRMYFTDPPAEKRLKKKIKNQNTEATDD